MSFNPTNDEHAIVEVVFGLTMSRPFAPHEIETLAKNHDIWRADLPRLGRMGNVPFFVGNLPIPDGFQLPFGTGVSFERIKPDGTLDWRILVDNTNVYVNCLSYTRWADVWGRARQYLIQTIEVAAASDNLVSGASLQYIDMFKWNGRPEDYRMDEIIQPGSHVPAALFEKGHLWHFHQGWFEPDENGRILERFHIDAMEGDFGIPVVKFDTYMQHQLSMNYTLSESISNGWIDSTFDKMHEKNKVLLKSFLTENMAKRINLYVA